MQHLQCSLPKPEQTNESTRTTAACSAELSLLQPGLPTAAFPASELESALCKWQTQCDLVRSRTGTDSDNFDFKKQKKPT